jgi:hypothetical protein
MDVFAVLQAEEVSERAAGVAGVAGLQVEVRVGDHHVAFGDDALDIQSQVGILAAQLAEGFPGLAEHAGVQVALVRGQGPPGAARRVGRQCRRVLAECRCGSQSATGLRPACGEFQLGSDVFRGTAENLKVRPRCAIVAALA